MLLARIDSKPPRPGQPPEPQFVWLTFRTKVLAGLAVVCLVLAAVMWMADKNTPGWFFAVLGQDIIIGGLGVLVGERASAPV